MENNNQDIKLCPACGAKNKSAYKYCNECGEPLNQSEYVGSANPSPNNITPQTSNNGYYGSQNAQNSYTPNYIPYDTHSQIIYEGVPDFYGVPAKDIYEFTGEKPTFFNKLRTEHFSGKAPYCWPLFVLGLIFGFFGMGCWYLYHKMYKPAAALIVGAIANAAIGFSSITLLFNTMLNNYTQEFFDSMLENPENPAAMEALLSDQTGLIVFALEGLSTIISIAVFVLTIVLPFFAYKQYKNFAVKKIRDEYGKSALPNLSTKGGTSGGTVVFACVLYAVIFIVSLSVIISFAVKFFQKSMEYSKNSTVYEQYEELPFNNEFYDYEDYFGGNSGDFW